MAMLNPSYVRIIMLLVLGLIASSWIQINYQFKTGAIYIAMMLIAIFLYSISDKLGANGLVNRLYGIDENWKFDTALGVAVGLAFVTLMNTTSVTIGTPSAIYPLTTFAEKIGIFSTLVVIGFLAPVGEESLFRGIFMWFGWQNLKSFAVAVIIVGIGFAGFHYQAYGAALPAAYVGAFIFSTLACILTVQTKSLLPAIIMHSIVNVNLYIQAEQLLVVGA